MTHGTDMALNGRDEEQKMQHEAEPSARIAVINDDTSFLDLMRDLLESEGGYEAVICREWEDARTFVKDQRPALVILDIRIGGEERGWAILNLLTLDPDTRQNTGDRLLGRHPITPSAPGLVEQIWRLCAAQTV